MSSDTDQNQVDSGQDDDFLKDFAAFAGGSSPADPKGQQEDTSAAVEPEDGAEPQKAEEPEAAEPTTEEAPEAQPAEKGEEQQPAADDPWKDHPQLKVLYDQAQEQAVQFKRQARKDARRVSNLSERLRTISGAVKEPEDGSEAKAKATALEDAVAKIEEDYPEVGKVLRQITESQKAQLAPVREAISTVASSAEDDALESEMALLDEQHNGWRELVKTEDFVSWVNAQTQATKVMLSSSLAADVGAGLALYKLSKGIIHQTAEPAPAAEAKPDAATEAKRKQQLEGGRDVRSRPAPAASGAPDDFEGAFGHFAEKKRQEAVAQRR